MHPLFCYFIIIKGAVVAVIVWYVDLRLPMQPQHIATLSTIYLHFVATLHCEFESRSGRGVQFYVIKFVCDMRQVGGFLRVLRFPPSINLIATI